jgi:hypothetical protein
MHDLARRRRLHPHAIVNRREGDAMNLRLPGMAGVFCLLIVPLSLTQGVPRNQSSETDRRSPPDAAVITDSGSTNTAGYRLVVYASRTVEWSVIRRRISHGCSQGTGKLPPELAQRFFRDLSDRMPLSKLPMGHCVKSASFGSTLRVSYGGTESPDLTCPASGIEAHKLLSDLAEINRVLGINKNMNGRPPSCEQAAPATAP